jgi:hypothetical protein
MAITQKKLESSKDKDKNNSKLTINVCGCRGCAPVPIQTESVPQSGAVAMSNLHI